MFNFNKTICGINITENGIQSFSKSLKVGPIQFTVNARKSGIMGSVAIPGTGLSKRNIQIIKFDDSTINP